MAHNHEDDNHGGKAINSRWEIWLVRLTKGVLVKMYSQSLILLRSLRASFFMPKNLTFRKIYVIISIDNSQNYYNFIRATIRGGVMVREALAFKNLWKILKQKEATTIKDGLLHFSNKKTMIEMEEDGKHYMYEIYIGAPTGFTVIGSYVLTDNVEDHDWVWKQLNSIGVTKEDLKIKPSGD